MSSISRTMIRLLVVLLVLAGRSFAATALGSVTIAGAEQSSGSAWDTGTVTATINGVAVSFSYGQFSTPTAIASALGALISQKYCKMLVYAQATGATLTFYQYGSNPMPSASITIVSSNPALFPGSSFSSTTLNLAGGGGGSPPNIAGINPGSDPVGASVTIGGTNFGSAGTVTFNDTAATTFTSWNATAIAVTVPNGATTGPVVVTVGGVASNGYNFIVTGSGGAASSTVSLISSSNSVTYGTSVTFTATVTSSGGTPSGTVTFNDFNGALTLGGATLSNGQATLTLSTLSPGTHSITATYSGNGVDNPSTSPVLLQTVNRRSMNLPSYCVY